MEKATHELSELFGQLGLPDDAESIQRFIASHRPLPPGVPLADAPFWSPSQAQFLREEIDDDADWAELIDTLAVLLSE
ncbi:DUF2789 domain-containing protein [Thauera sinica]|uniref:DUF2789 domain-containing protein n=1 Tax=Thauera sinica TaxID=2665146 RepID=A0ABW1AST5_9RHOO|nr:DUF2789 domain-containing protein [Thauera sp. K11]ATE61129.1 hypothetical protein CCZ27_15335 [Thauera sp. K11]